MFRDVLYDVLFSDTCFFIGMICGRCVTLWRQDICCHPKCMDTFGRSSGSDNSCDGSCVRPTPPKACGDSRRPQVASRKLGTAWRGQALVDDHPKIGGSTLVSTASKRGENPVHASQDPHKRTLSLGRWPVEERGRYAHVVVCGLTSVQESTIPARSLCAISELVELSGTRPGASAPVTHKLAARGGFLTSFGKHTLNVDVPIDGDKGMLNRSGMRQQQAMVPDGVVVIPHSGLPDVNRRACAATSSCARSHPHATWRRVDLSSSEASGCCHHLAAKCDEVHSDH